MAKQHKCPKCGGPIERVVQSQNSMLNSYQFDAVKAGDWFCSACQSNDRGHKSLCYWWEHELPDANEYHI